MKREQSTNSATGNYHLGFPVREVKLPPISNAVLEKIDKETGWALSMGLDLLCTGSYNKVVQFGRRHGLLEGEDLYGV
jgi:hypothetical protein